MKKRALSRTIISLLVSSIVLILCVATRGQAYSGNGNLIVHVTRTGACYHKAGCGSLRSSDITVTLEDAYVAGYQRCDRCNPPIYTGIAKRNSEKEKNNSNSSGETNNTRSRALIEGNNNESTSKLPLLLLSGAGGTIATVVIVKSTRESRRRKEDLLRQKQAYEERKHYYEEHYKGRTIKEIVEAPNNVTIDETGLVALGQITRERPYGDLTVYIPYSGKCYHKAATCQNTYGMRPINLYEAMPNGYLPCSRCSPPLETIPDWYRKIPRVIATKREFENNSL